MTPQAFRLLAVGDQITARGYSINPHPSRVIISKRYHSRALGWLLGTRSQGNFSGVGASAEALCQVYEFAEFPPPAVEGGSAQEALGETPF